MSDADHVLVQKAQSGDQKAFELLVRKYQGKIASVIGRYVYQREKVEDLTQEAFLKAYRALPSFRAESAFYTWLFRIAVNTAKNHLMSSNRVVPDNDLEIDEFMREGGAPELQDDGTPEHRILQKELMAVLQKAINGLAPPMKQVIEMRELEERSYEEIAVALDCPIGTVRSRIFRARQELSEQLRAYLGYS